MGTKNKPGSFDCYANAAPDEPMFVLLARDPIAPILVHLWADIKGKLDGYGPDGRGTDKMHEARRTAQSMVEYCRNTYGDIGDLRLRLAQLLYSASK